MSSLKNLGYSAWGFLGNGIVDTPDGGRSHRLVLLKELIGRGIHINMLQKNRDLLEAGEDFSSPSLAFRDDLPKVDAIFFEYRWNIPGRNCEVAKDSPDYTPDLDRQNELIDHYLKQDVPIIIWDKDQQLKQEDMQKFSGKKVMVLEPSLKPSSGRKSLLFPINIELLEAARASLPQYSAQDKKTQLIYIGNQYDRDDSFAEYYDRASGLLGEAAQVYGKWSGANKATGKPFEHVTFHGRVGFEAVADLYTSAFATVLIAPDRYYENGQYTQRLFEASWQMCLPFVPHEYAEAENIFPSELIITSAEDLAEKLVRLHGSSSTVRNLFEHLYSKLDLFSPKKQVDAIIGTIEALS